MRARIWAEELKSHLATAHSNLEEFFRVLELRITRNSQSNIEHQP